MPIFNNSSTSNINPEIDPYEIPIDELQKCEEKRRLSIKKSFFTWSSQKQFIDQNKFLFDSGTVFPSKKGKKNYRNSFILKSNKYAISGSSVNYDESENEYSSASDIINENGDSKDYFSMEDLDNITSLKKKFPKARNTIQLSESTLCYSSNTNTIKSVSMEFNGKSKAINMEENANNEDGINEFEDNQNNIEDNPNNSEKKEEVINYGFEKIQNNEKKEEVINHGFEEDQNIEKKEEVINYGFENNQNNEKKEEVINHGFEENQSNEKKEEVINYGFEEDYNNSEKKKKEDENIKDNIEINYENDSIKRKSIDIGDNDNISFDEFDDTEDESADEVFLFDDLNSNYSSPSRKFSSSSRRYSNPYPNKKLSSTRKTVTFCENIEIIEPKKYKKSKNIFKRAISKIIKKKEEENNIL